ncbi:hypothetical protein GQR58_017396 [Nymphon striatum]|nr:hypothetical protein GQR58_017396 [Nymphon striatum]
MLDEIFRLGTSNIKLHTDTNKIRLDKGCYIEFVGLRKTILDSASSRVTEYGESVGSCGFACQIIRAIPQSGNHRFDITHVYLTPLSINPYCVAQGLTNDISRNDSHRNMVKVQRFHCKAFSMEKPSQGDRPFEYEIEGEREREREKEKRKKKRVKDILTFVTTWYLSVVLRESIQPPSSSSPHPLQHPHPLKHPHPLQHLHHLQHPHHLHHPQHHPQHPHQLHHPQHQLQHHPQLNYDPLHHHYHPQHHYDHPQQHHHHQHQLGLLLRKGLLSRSPRRDIFSSQPDSD